MPPHDSRFDTLLRISQSQPTASSAMLNLLAQAIEQAEAESDADAKPLSGKPKELFTCHE
ncbi:MULTISPECIES: hypothetical protein [unclassified Microcoleus]|uniref:hypothetical protein n=1 Tax=unclassified Microcoleus TaxID=2642155 RepID=UPI002FCF7426